ncbi:hypothetical protein JRQ81_019369, partial [Phrynocephalus forsythii]
AVGEAQGHLLQHKDGTPLMYYQCWKVTSLALNRMGIHGWHFRGHIDGRALDYDPTGIQRIGCWKSHKFKIYVRPLPDH